MRALAVLALTAAGLASGAAAPPPAPPYGSPLSLPQAKGVMAAAMADAARRRTDVAVVIVDPFGEMVMLERGTGAQYASTDIALAKARSTARYRRASALFTEQIKGGDVSTQLLPGVAGMGGGGVLLVSGGRIVGAIGISGLQAEDVAKAAAASLK